MHMFYRDQYDAFDNIIKKVEISEENFRFDHDGSGVWLTKKTTVEFIPLHMVLKVVLDKDKIGEINV